MTSRTHLADVRPTFVCLPRWLVAMVLLPFSLLTQAHGSSGQLWAFGQNHDGQLADGTTTDKTSPAQVATGITAIAAGGSATEGSHTFYLKTDGTLWAVGYNAYGQLGDGTTVDRSLPIQVATGVSAVSAGINHSLFLKTEGTLWAMGSNQYGQLGDGSTTHRATPVQVASGVAAIAAGGNHSLFLKTNGTLWAAGYNNFGQLGDGTRPTNQPTPVQIATGVGAISAGGSHSLFLKTDSTLWVTGWNASGQLGVGPASSQLGTPAQLTTGVRAIAAGNQHSLYLKTDGTLWAMGQNLFGQLGDGTMPTNQKLPVQVTTGVSAVAAGASHSLLLKSNGTLWAMGLNTSGQLGDGSINNRGTPVLVTDEVLSASGGAESSFFIKAPGLTTQLDSWTMLSSGPTNDFLDLIYADSRFVAGTAGVAPAGTGGLSLTSTDGFAWTTSNLGELPNLGLNGLAHGNGMYVGVGALELASGGAISSSLDGLTWSAGLSTPQPLRSVVFGNGQFVAVGDGGLIESSSDGLSWTLRSSGTTSNLQGVAYGNNLFVAVGISGTVLTSPDAVTWTARAAGSSGTNNNLTSVAFGNNQFVAVGNGVVTSPDGTTWTQRVSATSDGTNYHTVTYRVGLYVAVGVDSSAQSVVVHSPDAITWNAHYPGLSSPLRAISHGSNRFVIVGDNGTVLTSQPVGSAPVIATPPVSQSVYAGNPVSFSVAATGAPTFTYQWRKNSLPIAGATSATYTIPVADVADAGSITVLVTNSAGNVVSAAATLTVLKADQTISFAALPNRFYGDAPFTLSATANPSGLPVTFSLVSGPVALSGNTVTVIGMGPVTIRASQAGSSSYYAATSVDRSFSVGKGTPVITWPSPASITYGTALDSTQLNATANMPGSFSYSPSAGTLPSSGTQTLTATFTPTDSANYNTTSAQQTIFVTKTVVSVTLGNLSANFDGAAHAATATTSAGVLPVDFTYDGSPAAPINVGSYAVVATVNHPNHQGSATGTLTISKADQTITFAALPTRRVGDAPFSLSAAASPSGLPVTYSVVSGPATIALNIVTLTDVGQVTIRADQPGNGFYNPAPPVDRSFSVSSPTPQITWTLPATITYGTPLSATQLNATADVPGTFSYSPASGTLLPSGNHTITATFTPADPTNYFSASAQQTVAVNKAPATVVLASLNATYDGVAHAATATTTPASLSVSITYNGTSTSPPIDAGTYTVVGTINDANHQGSATGTLTISRSTPVITWRTPAPILFGTVLGDAQLNATASIAGSFAYNPTAGTSLTKGVRTLTAIFSPTDTTNYTGVTIERSLSIFSEDAPVITIHPQAQTVVAGNSVTLSVAARGKPTPTFQWKKAGIAINGATGNTYAVNPATGADAGAYTVEAINPEGTVRSDAAILTVIVAPTVATIAFAIE